MALTSGQLAKKSGVGVEALRFYEREGLLPEPARLASGYRQYPAGAVERVQFIRRAQLLGFQLKDIKELLALRDDPTADRHEVRDKAVAACDGSGPAAHCPILTAAY